VVSEVDSEISHCIDGVHIPKRVGVFGGGFELLGVFLVQLFLMAFLVHL